MLQVGSGKSNKLRIPRIGKMESSAFCRKICKNKHDRKSCKIKCVLGPREMIYVRTSPVTDKNSVASSTISSTTISTITTSVDNNATTSASNTSVSDVTNSTASETATSVDESINSTISNTTTGNSNNGTASSLTSDESTASVTTAASNVEVVFQEIHLENNKNTSDKPQVVVVLQKIFDKD